MFYLFALLIIVTLVWSYSAYGIRTALAIGWGLMVLVPTWMERTFGPLNIDLRSVIGLVLLASLALHPGTRLRGRWVLLDWLVGSLVFFQIMTHLLTVKFAPGIFSSVFLASLLPYLLGRLAFPSLQEMRGAMWVMALVCVVLFLWSGFESITKINPIFALAGMDGAFSSPHQFRWGFKRAVGPLTHPIYFGMLSVILLPWALEGAVMARQRLGPAWWLYLPVLLAGAVFFSMSRGPQLAFLIALYLTAIFWWPRWRMRLIAGAAALSVAILVGREVALEALHVWSTESQGYKLHIQVDGEYVEYSGTTHRLLQFIVYRRAMENAGWLGFGGLGEKLEGYVEPHLMGLFESIDNQYIFVIVTSGYLGLTLFLAIALCGMIYLAKLALNLPQEPARVAGALFGTLVATMVAMFWVWFAQDFGFLWLFQMGLAASWYAERRQPAFWPDEVSQPPLLASTRQRPRRLVPGHPAPPAPA